MSSTLTASTDGSLDDRGRLSLPRPSTGSGLRGRVAAWATSQLPLPRIGRPLPVSAPSAYPEFLITALRGRRVSGVDPAGHDHLDRAYLPEIRAIRVPQQSVRDTRAATKAGLDAPQLHGADVAPRVLPVRRARRLPSARATFRLSVSSDIPTTVLQGGSRLLLSAEADWRLWNTVEPAGLANQRGVHFRDRHLHRHQEHDG
jgi:hypothetical protein